MEFKVAVGETGKELWVRQSSDDQYTCIPLGAAEIPSDPAKLFEFLTAKMKDEGVVPPDAVFRLT